MDPAQRTRGHGSLLVREFIRESTSRGATRVDLTTDKHRNEGPNAFYRAMGFTLCREITSPEGRVLNEYVLDPLTATRVDIEVGQSRLAWRP